MEGVSYFVSAIVAHKGIIENGKILKEGREDGAGGIRLYCTIGIGSKEENKERFEKAVKRAVPFARVVEWDFLDLFLPWISLPEYDGWYRKSYLVSLMLMKDRKEEKYYDVKIFSRLTRTFNRDMAISEVSMEAGKKHPDFNVYSVEVKCMENLGNSEELLTSEHSQN